MRLPKARLSGAADRAADAAATSTVLRFSSARGIETLIDTVMTELHVLEREQRRWLRSNTQSVLFTGHPHAPDDFFVLEFMYALHTQLKEKKVYVITLLERAYAHGFTGYHGEYERLVTERDWIQLQTAIEQGGCEPRH